MIGRGGYPLGGVRAYLGLEAPSRPWIAFPGFGRSRVVGFGFNAFIGSTGQIAASGRPSSPWASVVFGGDLEQPYPGTQGDVWAPQGRWRSPR